MNDAELTELLQECAPRLGLRYHGFSNVRGQVLKRIARRIRELRLPGVAAYRARLAEEAAEWAALERLCVVTLSRFYRDAAVWQALTEPAHLSEWAPFDADRNLAAVGPVKLSTVGTPAPQVSETTVKRAEEPRLLEYSWGGGDIRWELEPRGSGTRLTLWHNINRGFIAWAPRAGTSASTSSSGSSRASRLDASSAARR